MTKGQNETVIRRPIVIATLSGIAITVSPQDPIKALFWSAVINAVVSVPVMAMMMLITEP